MPRKPTDLEILHAHVVAMCELVAAPISEFRTLLAALSKKGIITFEEYMSLKQHPKTIAAQSQIASDLAVKVQARVRDQLAEVQGDVQ